MAFLQYLQVSDLDLEERKGNLYCSLFNKAVASSPLYASGSLSPSAKSGDISIEIAAEMRAVGGHGLPRQGKFLERRDVIQMLESHPRTHDRIPTDKGSSSREETSFKCSNHTRERMTVSLPV